MKSNTLPGMIKRFIYEYLPAYRGGSPNTISAYADVISLFLKFLFNRKKIIPTKITIDDLSVQNILSFLNYLEKERGNGVSTRNARLAGIKSFAKYLLFEKPEWAGHLHRIMSIPTKKNSVKILGYLTRKEMDAVLAAPDNSWLGQRDQLMFSLMYNTGIRVSEIINMKVTDVICETRNNSIRITGKGRKNRLLPIWKSTALALKKWIKFNKFRTESILFPNRSGIKMSRSAFAKRLDNAVTTASETCKELKQKKVSPHIIRHTMAMHMLQSGIDITVIAMWLGHESIDTTHIYLDTDMQMKSKSLQALQEPKSKTLRYKPTDELLALLEGVYYAE